MGAHAFAVEGSGPGPAMRRRLAGFVMTLRGVGFVIGQAEAQDAARLIAAPLPSGPKACAPRCGLCSLRAARTSRASTSCSTPSGARGASGEPPGSTLKALLRARRDGSSMAQARAAREMIRRMWATRALWAPPLKAEGDEGGASAHDALATKDIAALIGERERAGAADLAERLARAMRARLTRRERARRRGRRLDLRATIRLSVARGGEPVDLKFRRRKIKPLRLVALLDASGSMETYVSFFTRFLHAVTQVFRESEAFFFHTRLAHVSSALKERDPARALDRLALMAAGVGGGTKIGECLTAFNRRHARRVIHSRTCVMIFSDGYDTGPPELLQSALRDLRRRCKRIVWLNPLTGRDGFSPSARGMQAALPYLDLFAPAHNLESLAALEPYLARI